MQEAIVDPSEKADRAGYAEEQLHTGQIAGVVAGGCHKVQRHGRAANGKEPCAYAAEKAADDACRGLRCQLHPPCRQQEVQRENHQKDGENDHQHMKIQCIHNAQHQQTGQRKGNGGRQGEPPLDMPPVFPAQNHAKKLVDHDGQRRGVNHIKIERQYHHQKDHRAETSHRLDDPGDQAGCCHHKPDHCDIPPAQHKIRCCHITTLWEKRKALTLTNIFEF